MPPSQQDLELWLTKIRQAKSRTEVFKLLDEFRPSDWTDEQRSVMGKTYIRVLSGMAPAQEDSAANQQDKSDGPVWYEKM